MEKRIIQKKELILSSGESSLTFKVDHEGMQVGMYVGKGSTYALEQIDHADKKRLIKWLIDDLLA